MLWGYNTQVEGTESSLQGFFELDGRSVAENTTLKPRACELWQAWGVAESKMLQTFPPIKPKEIIWNHQQNRHWIQHGGIRTASRANPTHEANLLKATQAEVHAGRMSADQ